MIVSRLRTSLASSAGLCAPASSTLRRRLAAGLPTLISISNAANRSRPSASRFFAFSAVFAATHFSHAVSENVADGNPSAFTGMVLDGALSSAIGLTAGSIGATEHRRRNRGRAQIIVTANRLQAVVSPWIEAQTG